MLRKERQEVTNTPLRPMPVAARSKAWLCGRSLAGIVGSNPAGAMESVSCECYLVRGLITRPEESYRV
jgi:hypothetical protein